jgi:hypothetical protein
MRILVTSGQADRSSCRYSHPAETGRLNPYVGPGGGNIETLLDDASFGVFAQPHQAFVKPMQTPDILWMLTGSRQGAVEAEIGGGQEAIRTDTRSQSQNVTSCGSLNADTFSCRRQLGST